MTDAPLVICSKSSWLPSIRREHAIARSAATAGHRVVFVERALHMRAALDSSARRRWLRGARADCVSGIEVWSQSTLVPGHRSRVAQSADALRLARTLRHITGIRDCTVVATQPWEWPALMAVPAGRRVFDCADDWAALVPHAARTVTQLNARIAAEADAVILASAALAPMFAAREPVVVRNGTDEMMLRTPPTPPPAEHRMVYAGTLSERFDAPLMAVVLQRLPEWSLQLYGECRYAGRGADPSPELAALLGQGRVSWHGPVERDELVGVLDAARVLVAPLRAALARGQDSMKLYDYTARGRPIVCTVGGLGPDAQIAGAGVCEAGTATEFADAVAGADQDPQATTARRAWAQDNAWSHRWQAWSEAAFA